jgi:hypothetical protein
MCAHGLLLPLLALILVLCPPPLLHAVLIELGEQMVPILLCRDHHVARRKLALGARCPVDLHLQKGLQQLLGDAPATVTTA